jgi:hypothetical protein
MSYTVASVAAVSECFVLRNKYFLRRRRTSAAKAGAFKISHLSQR